MDPPERHLKFQNYQKQKEVWPHEGQHILAQSDDDTIVVYQAYNKRIGTYAVQNKKFLGCNDFSPTRMTWIKTNFLWMMYRCDWGTKDKNQEMVLAIWLKRSAFQKLLDHAVHSTYKPTVYGPKENYDKIATQGRQKLDGFGFVRLQWDPDHSPSGSPHPKRRAIQLGMKCVTSFVDGTDIVQIKDISEFCRTQKAYFDQKKMDLFETPFEEVYTGFDEMTSQRIQISNWDPITRTSSNCKNLFELTAEQQLAVEEKEKKRENFRAKEKEELKNRKEEKIQKEKQERKEQPTEDKAEVL